ncbi:MAG: DUF4832 domain-containing protein [Chthoniobacteraceae bacterium]
MRLQPAPSPADNPLKGLVPYAGHGHERASHFPHSLEFDYLPLAKLMRGPSTFVWEPLDSLLNKVASRGNQTIFRVWIEYPGHKSGLPEYLRAQGVKVTAWKNPDEEETCYSPDYEDERVVSALESFIAALGKRYDGDPRIGFITAGLLGSWGEWHTSPRDDLFASPKTQRRILVAYEEAFNKTPILLRYPVGKDDERNAANAHHHMGYHDDSFAWGTLDRGKKDDWFFMPILKKAGDAALNKWRTQPIGGEVRPEIWGQIFDAKPAHPKAQDFAECVRQTHVSWLMESGMFREKAQAARYAGAVAHVRRMGYDFHVATAEITRAGSEVRCSLTVINQGVAPFYQDWRLELAALGAEGKVEHRWPVDWKLTGLFPGNDAREWKASLKLPAKPLAGLTLALRVIHPLPNGKPLRFANAGQDRYALGWLSLGPLP